MSEQQPPWPPRVGDRVAVKDTGVPGTMAAGVGAAETQRFLVDIEPQALQKALHELGLPKATAPERHAYRLEDLGPQPPNGGHVQSGVEY